ncbi:MAG: MBL fold metallo-hydrolase [Proteobacteria bacterium]|nr:MBL fold metallo-hydrolase [Pseudomonadota bacterium]
MPKLSICFLVFSLVVMPQLAAGQSFQTDTVKTDKGDLKISFIGHGSLMFEFKGLVIHVDPYGQQADYNKLPKADLVLITHEHGDHFDENTLASIRTKKTHLLLTETCSQKVRGGTVLKNGDSKTVRGIKIEAVPAYNLIHTRSPGKPYHPKGQGNGYIMTFGDKRVYVAGDTENTPEMKGLKNIDIAFLPMNLPYTMTPKMVADAARAFLPKILYPYHYGKTDTSALLKLLKDVKGVEVRIRKM